MFTNMQFPSTLINQHYALCHLHASSKYCDVSISVHTHTNALSNNDHIWQWTYKFNMQFLNRSTLWGICTNSYSCRSCVWSRDKVCMFTHIVLKQACQYVYGCLSSYIITYPNTCLCPHTSNFWTQWNIGKYMHSHIIQMNILSITYQHIQTYSYANMQFWTFILGVHTPFNTFSFLSKTIYWWMAINAHIDACSHTYCFWVWLNIVIYTHDHAYAVSEWIHRSVYRRYSLTSASWGSSM